MQDTIDSVSMTLEDIFTSPVITFSPDKVLSEALVLMNQKKISALIIVENNKPVGIITERDSVLLAYQRKDISKLAVRDVMSCPLVTAPLSMDYRDGYKLIIDKRVRHLIVLDDKGDLAGIVTESDFLKHLGDEFLVRFKEVGAVMTRSVLTLPTDTIVDDAIRMMTHAHVSCVIVEHEGQPQGIITERDLVKYSEDIEQVVNQSITSIMASPVYSVNEDTSLPLAIQSMDEKRIRHLVIVDKGGSIVGLVTRHDIVKVLYDRHVEHMSERLKKKEIELELLQAELQTERELSHYKKLLSESQRMAHIGSWELNLIRDELWWSEEVFHIFEIDPGKFSASYEAFLQLVHEDDRAAVNHAYSQSLETRKPYEITHRLKFEDGRIKYVSERCETFYNSEGKLIRSIGTVQEVTRYRNIEADLKQSKAHLRTLIDTLPDLVWLKDPDGIYLDCNSKFETLYDTTREELLGRSDYDYVDKDLADFFRHHDKQAMKKGGASMNEETVKFASDGHSEHLETIKTPMFDEQGTLLGVLGVSRDMSQRKLAEQALAKNEQKFRAIFNSTFQFIGLMTPEGTLIEANEAALSFAGLTPQDVVDKPLWETHWWRGDKARVKQLKQGIKQAAAGEFVRYSVDIEGEGKTETIDFSLKPVFDEQGQVELLIPEGRVITEQKQAEESLRQSENRLRTVVENMPVMLDAVDEQGNILVWNREAEKVTGYSADEIIANPKAWELLYPDKDYREKMIKEWGQAGDHRDWLWKVRAKGGSDLSIEWSNISGQFPIPGWASWGVGKDVSERIAARQSLQESEQRFRGIFEQAAVGVALINSINGLFLRINQRYCDIVGYSLQEMSNKRSFQDITHPDDLVLYENQMEKMRAGEIREYSLEKRYYRKDGAVVWVNLTVSPTWEVGEAPTTLIAVVEDITEKKVIGDQLQRNEQMFRVLASLSPVGIFRIDTDGECIYINDMASRLIGLPKIDCMGNGWVKNLQQAERPWMWNQWLEEIKAGGYVRKEYHFEHEKGNRVWVIAEARPELDKKGRAKGYIGTFTDITDLKNSESKRIEREKELSNAQQIAHLGSWFWNIETGEERWSDEQFRLLGYKPGDFEPRHEHFEDALHPVDKDRVLDAVQQTLEQDVPFKVEYRIIYPDGSSHWLMSVGGVTRYRKGKPLFFTGTSLDITERKAFEEKLLRSESRLIEAQNLARLAGFGFHLHQEEINWSNQLFSIFDIDSSSAAPEFHEIISRIHPDDQKAIVKALEQAKNHGNFPLNEFRFFPQPDIEKFISVKCRVLTNSSGQFERLVGTLQDVTELRQAEMDRARLQRELQQAQKMEALGQLTGGIAHDFNNILSTILGYSELAKEKFENELPQKMNTYLHEIKQAGERGRDLVNQMLQFSRTDEMEPQLIYVSPLMEEVVNMLSAILPSSIRISLEVESDLPRVLVNPVQIHQSMMNLIINARDAIQGKGEIHINLSQYLPNKECSVCHEMMKDDYLVISVSDTGGGIAEEIKDRIFDPFFTTKQPGKGTGMGLAVIHGAVKSANGHIRVESEVGKGSTFSLYLPRVENLKAKEQGTMELIKNIPAVEHSGYRIVIVDDEHAVLGFMEELLCSRGNRVIPFSESDKALKWIEENRQDMDLLVADQTMPGWSGLELAQQVKQFDASIPVILCSGYSEAVNETNYMNFDVDGFVAKPLKLSELVEKIDQLISNQ